uniref:Uncharacterized protein n=1 Tax=Triticum urartu TaxID=4572 RepID=A0A8R7UGX0_TRIUA
MKDLVLDRFVLVGADSKYIFTYGTSRCALAKLFF